MIVKAQPFSGPKAGCSPTSPVSCPVTSAIPTPSCCIPGPPGPAGQSIPGLQGPAGPPGPATSAIEETLLNSINDKVFNLLRLLEVLTILQTVSLSMQQGMQVLNSIAELGSESNLKLEEIKAKLDAEIASLSGIISALSTLHADNVVQEGKLDTLHADNLNSLSRLELFNSSFDSVKQFTRDQEVIRVQQDELGVLTKILGTLERVETQIKLVTGEENV